MMRSRILLKKEINKESKEISQLKEEKLKDIELKERIIELENELKEEKIKNKNLNLELKELKQELENEKIKNKEFNTRSKLINSN